ncbi:EAF6 [[Candida] subhashii]|uniref:Chromatin modification-related protein EAF6 n=1 Tax=[Candida] subhashii TaxID=561895 RepID=A0A8J5QK53_9ASCO|nr:EAF6 [[Candida] subhashii]KAG7663613.1 EAF6 [[Candida] subhashii]
MTNTKESKEAKSSPSKAATSPKTKVTNVTTAAKSDTTTKTDVTTTATTKTATTTATKDEKASDTTSATNGNTSNSKEKSSSDASIEKYAEIKNKLTQQILRKQELTEKLNSLEDSIYQKELDYFEESSIGNIVKGFENFSKSGGGGVGGNKRRITYTEDDHIFSLSSVNYIKGLMKRQGISNISSSTGGGGNKDDFDDYEDSVDPTGGINVAQKSGSSDSISSSSAGTPSRKRKARTMDD